MDSSPSIAPEQERSAEARPRLASLARERGSEMALRAAFVLAFVYICRELVLPVALGGIFAVVLGPLHGRLRRSLGRAGSLAPALVTTGVLLVIVTPVSLMTWQAAAAANDLLVGGAIGDVGALGERTMRWLAERLALDAANDATLRQTVRELFGQLSASAGALVARELGAFPRYVTDGFLITLSFYYCLRDGQSAIAWLRRIAPTNERQSDALLLGMRGAIHGTVLGIFVVGLVQGGVCLVALLALRIPGAFLWGGLAAICSVLPVVGTAPVTAGATIYLFGVGRPEAAAVMLGTALFVAAIDNVVRPWVQSSHDRTHPLLELLAIFGGLAALGPSGLFIGPVLAAMALWAITSGRPDRPAIG